MRILNKEQEESLYRLIEHWLELNNKYNKLQQRIDKALSKLEEIDLYDEYITIHSDFINDTKGILKGSDSNE
jgi:hypothetical protein